MFLYSDKRVLSSASNHSNSSTPPLLPIVVRTYYKLSSIVQHLSIDCFVL